MLSLIAGVTKDLISKMKQCAMKDTGEVGRLVFRGWGFIYISWAQSEGESPLHLSQPLIYLEDNVKFNQKSGKTEQLNFKDGEPREPVALKA